MGSGFESFSIQHFSALFAFGIITYAAIRKGQNVEEPSKTNLGLIIAGLTLSALILESVVKFAFGTYDILTDLPLFMCDLVAMVLPFILLYQNRKWTGILYFWALAGTLQALITPDLQQGFPSFHFFRYFISHGGIVVAVLYAVVVHRIQIRWQDFFNAIMYAQIYLVGIHLINHGLGSNYAYTMQKPPGPSILDFMGPWPLYILVGEVVMVILFLMLMIPFIIQQRRLKEEVLSSKMENPAN